jgi:hypothetical protein
MEIIKALEVIDPKSAKKLTIEVLDAFERHQDGSGQVILQTNQDGVEDWHTGVGQVEALETKMENDFVFIQPSLKGTLIEQYIKKYNGFRTRIMAMSPKSSYTVHKDYTPRVHIPIVTNPNAWMVWPNHQRCYHLRDGAVYYTDTTKPHTALNGSLDEVRIHIVMCIETPLA